MKKYVQPLTTIHHLEAESLMQIAVSDSYSDQPALAPRRNRIVLESFEDETEEKEQVVLTINSVWDD